MAADPGAPGAAESDDARVVDHEVMSVVVRSTPRYGRFLGIGIVGGLVVAVILTVLAGLNDGSGGPMSTGISGVLWVFAVYSAVCVGVGLLAMALLAIVLGRIATSHARTLRAERDTTLTVDLHRPASDDVPTWVRDADDLRPGGRRPRG